MFNTVPKLEFVSLIPEIAHLAPIVPATEARPHWMDNAIRNYVSNRKSPDYLLEHNLHVARCPGIYNMYRQGFVMRTWQDMRVTTNGDGESFTWSSPLDQSVISPESGAAMGWHPTEQLIEFTGDYPNALRNIIKVQTPWRCLIPSGYQLMEMQVPYADDKRFTLLPGLYDRRYGVAQINPQLLWHCMDGDELIPAGTPLAYYVLVPKVEVDMECVPADDTFRMVNRLTILSKASQFHPNLIRFRALMNKFFGG